MRILITSAYPLNGETGSALMSKILASEFSKKHKVVYLCLGEKFEEEKVTLNLKYLKIPSNNINDVWVPTLSPLNVDKIYKKLDEFSPDVVHAQNIVFGGLLSLVWAKERNVPYVLTLHSIPTEGISYVFPNLKKTKIIPFTNFQPSKGYIKAFLNHVDSVVALNNTIVKSLKKISKKINYKIINNGINLKDFTSLSITKPGKQFNFIYPGTYIGRKNQEFLLKVFKNLPSSYKLNLYGNKKSGFLYVKKLENIIKKEKIKNVTLNDYASGKDILNVYSNAHYLVSASVKEVQSLVIIEALAAGKPVIALQNETTKEIINSKNGLILPTKTSAERFAEELKKYVNVTSKNYIKAANEARKSVSKFDIENTSEQLVELYKKVISDKKLNAKSRIELSSTLKEIIPDQFKNLFEGLLKNSQKRKKLNTLKLFLIVSSIFGWVWALVSKSIRFATLAAKSINIKNSSQT